MRRLVTFLIFILSAVCFSKAAGIVSGTVFRISTTYTGNKTLMVENSALDNGKQVSVWTETGTNSQRWRITSAEDGAFYIDNAYTGKRLLRQSNISIAQSALNTSSAYQWTLIPITGVGYDDCYYITNKTGETDYVLELVPGAAIDKDAAPVRLAEKSNEKLPRQIWKIEQTQDIPNEVTIAMQGAMMDGWANRHFKWLSEETTGIWGEAECLEIILDAYETTGQKKYKEMFETAYAYFVSGNGGWNVQGNGKDWCSWNAYNDDVTWAVLASIRAHHLFKSHPNQDINYLKLAKDNFDTMYKRALRSVDGLTLLGWSEDEGKTGPLSCSNGPAEVAACYLAEATGDSLYYRKAKMLYDNQRIYFYDSSTGRVYDGFDSNWASPYNQGTFLGTAVMLYNRYKDEKYKKDAELILKFSYDDFCNNNNIITACNSEEDPYDKIRAIMFRYVRRFAVEFGRPEYSEWLQKNALQAYNNRNSSGLSRVNWEVKTDETVDWTPHSAFSAVAAAVNSKIDVTTTVKAAFDNIQAGSFDYISRVYSENHLAGNQMELVDMEDGGYLGYNIVDCQNDFATAVEFTLSNGATARTIELRLGSPTGKLLASVIVPASDNSFKTIQGTLNEELVGRNNIYLVFKGTANALRIKSFKFISGGTNFSEIENNDITDDGGVLESQYAGVNAQNSLTKLTDNDASTKYVVENKSDLWIEYTASARYVLTSYSITSADDNALCDPKSWTLYGSKDGTTWSALDTRTGQIFGNRKSTLNFSVSSDVDFQYYKLHITANNGASNTQIAEWQLFGERHTDSYVQDFTKSGGTLSSKASIDGSDDSLLSLNDNKAETYYSIAASELPVWIQYKSDVAVQLKGYSITAAGDSKYDPKSWTIEGSADGQNWTEIDSRSNEVFSARYICNNYEKSNSAKYTHFRLQITAANSNEVRISEWQIHGTSLNTYDVTSNKGGVITARWEGKSGEEYGKLIDGSVSKKYLVDGYKSFWAIYQSARPLVLTAYSLTSANDNPTKDPQTWVLYGSNDNKKWTILDEQKNQEFIYRNTTLYYPVEGADKYTYFKLDVLENKGAKGIQLAEWQMFGLFNEYQEDITENGGTLTALHPATDGTSLSDLTDNNEISKYYLDITKNVFGEGIWVKYQSPISMILSSYSLTSSNDSQNNDPKEWKLQGSNDDVNWVDIDSQSEASFDSRSERKVFNVNTENGYTYFRLFITARKGVAKGFQLAEWELFGSPASGIGEETIENDAIKFYPNQVVDLVTIELVEESVVTICDLKGTIMESFTLQQDMSKIDMSNYQSGTYILKIQSDSYSKTGFLLKQ